MPALISPLLTFSLIIIGGLVGLKYKDKLHLVLGYTAGVLLAVVSFEIFPKIIKQVGELNIEPIIPMIAFVLGFLGFHLLEKILLIHHAQEDEYVAHTHPSVGILSALALSGHSFLDGVGIGLGFQVSQELGILITIAVISHGFADGLNTVTLALVNKCTTQRAFSLLLLNATAPVLGFIASGFLSIPAYFLVIYLGFFAGFLLYIGASEILPEAHSPHSSLGNSVMTILGIVTIFLITRIL
ncbi:MAG: ZIP family metal transporter [Microgenomates group bacterium]|jgi:ZIP family zinc transporter